MKMIIDQMSMIVYQMFITQKTVQRATSQYKQAGEWDKAADILATMGDIYRKQVDDPLEIF